ncbi:unnamed protein product [Plutella xylostella]|uniref:(diamondback moth) hypothetical protein n=1 Tax=Plutella xylostella TaxID=51655 RepID=A0A8S4G7L4_PLUXY|nr:unnamed protein product [Plutella xylostella]
MLGYCFKSTISLTSMVEMVATREKSAMVRLDPAAYLDSPRKVFRWARASCNFFRSSGFSGAVPNIWGY